MKTLNGVMTGALCSWFIVIGGWDIMTMVVAENPPQAPDCSSAVMSLGDCLTFVTGQSVMPSTKCCSGVMDVHVHMRVCLCELAEDDNNVTGTIPGYQPELAAQLPTLCKIQGANVSECPALLGKIPANNTTSPGGGTSDHMPASPVPEVPAATGYKLATSPRYSSFICLGVALSWSLFTNS